MTSPARRISCPRATAAIVTVLTPDSASIHLKLGESEYNQSVSTEGVRADSVPLRGQVCLRLLELRAGKGRAEEGTYETGGGGQRAR